MKDILENLVDAHTALKMKDPGNELIPLMELGPDGKYIFSEEYRNRFVDKRDDYGTFGYVRYTKAINQELNEQSNIQ